MISKIVKYFLFIFCCLSFFFTPYYFSKLEKDNRWQAPLLSGDKRTTKPIFTPEQWLAGKYQKQYNQYAKDRSPMRQLFVRARNQAEYEIFGDLANTNYFLGKDNHIFDKSYCNAYAGFDYKGFEWIDEKARKLEVIKDYLSDKNKHFLILTPPGAPHIHEDKLPTVFQITSKDSTNRTQFREAFKRRDIPYIDFDYLPNIQDTLDFMLYPKGGVHWGYYAVGTAMDTIRNYMTEEFNLNIGEINWKDSIPFSKDFKGTDRELIRGTNMLFDFEFEALPYPVYSFENIQNTNRPSLLVMGDSYYKMLEEEGFQKGLFSNKSAFFNYFRYLLSSQKININELRNNPKSLVEEVLKYDILMLCYAESNLKKMDFGFIETLYEGILLESKK